MKTWTRRTRDMTLALLVVLLALRLCLAFVVKTVVNHQLAQLSGYRASIDGIGLSLWRGAYQIEGLDIRKKEGQATQPFFHAPLIDLALQWKALFQGKVVASVTIDDGRLNFENGPAPAQRQSGQGEDWGQLMKSLVPIQINRFRLKGNEIHFRDPYAQPPVDVRLESLELLAEDLSSRDAGGLGSVSASARVMGDARLALHARFNPYAPAPTFDYGATMEGLKLHDLNPFLLRYAGFDVQAGTLDLYSEAAAAEGKFKGYVKPMLKGLKAMKPHEPLKVGKLVKKALAGAVGVLFRNSRAQVATKIEFSGAFKDPHISLWGAVRYLFRNAFVQALPPRLEQAVRVEDLKD